MHITFTHDEDGTDVDIVCDFIAHTNGTGCWSTAEKAVRVTGLSIYIYEDESGDLGIYYDEDTWNDDKDGLIYTDELFLQEVQEQLATIAGLADVADSFDYSEQGMQDDGRVSCDAGYKLVTRLRELIAADNALQK